MGAVTLETWERFYDRVVQRGSDWPRNLWFAAVEDGLSAMLPAQSRLLVQYRQDVAELRELERTAAGSYRDATRMAQLEAEIMRLIGIADQSIRDGTVSAGEPREPNRPRAHERPRVGFWLGALILGVAMLCGALLGATYYHQQRVSARMERDWAALQQRLTAQAADERAALQMRIRSADRVQASLATLQAELRANVDEFNKLMSASLRSVAALGGSEASAPQRALAVQDRAGREAIERLRARTAALERQHEQVDGSLSLLAQRLRDLDGGVDRLAERLAAATAGFERAESQMATIQAQAPEIALWLEGQRQALAQDLELRRQAIGELGAEIAMVQGALEHSRDQLAAVDRSLAQDPARVRQQGDDRNLDRSDAAGRQPRDVSSQEARLSTIQDGMRQQIDAVLAQLAEQADVAALRSEDMLKRAEGQAIRQLEVVAEQAIGGLSEAHGAQLAELRQWAAAIQAELEQTSDGLVAGWRGMDEAVAARQLEVLAELDQYAATLEGRVQEFLKALDVIVARSNG